MMGENEKPFSLGILVGRFQTIHAGHEQMIYTALALCRQGGIFIGSAQEAGTAKNPFSYETRERLLRLLFGQQVRIFPLPDIGVGNNGAWGEYVLENVKARYGTYPDLLVSGKETRRISWFDGVQQVRISELYIPKTIDISASQMRDFFLHDDRARWQQYTNPALWGQYDALRRLVLESKDNDCTASL